MIYEAYLSDRNGCGGGDDGGKNNLEERNKKEGKHKHGEEFRFCLLLTFW